MVGDGRPFVAALVVVDGEVAPAWARRNGLAFTTVSEFAREPRWWPRSSEPSTT